MISPEGRSDPYEPGFSGAVAPDLPQQGIDPSPERLPLPPLGLGKLRQRGFIADAPQIGVVLPAQELLRDLHAEMQRTILCLRGPRREVGPQPVEGPSAQAGACGL